MKLTHLRVRNFRNLEDLALDFPSFYAALCGKNDSGKSNVLLALRTALREPDPFGYRGYEEAVSLKDDYPKWHGPAAKDDRRVISIAASFDVHQDRDEGLHKFLLAYLAIEGTPSTLTVSLTITYAADEPQGTPTLTVNDVAYTELQADEVWKKLQSSLIVLYYNSIDPAEGYRYGPRPGGNLGDLASGDSEQLDALKQRITKDLKKITLQHQREISELLGKLKEKHKVGLSIPTFGVEYLPLSITLGDKAMDVALDNWGSGTRNRTLILLTLFRARKIAEAKTTASKVTPIIVIEEPESFLHPSAQAEFGKLLQDLAEEFNVQVIVTTHSPYFLSQATPRANVLLERRIERNQVRETLRVPTDGADWMTPFGLALGIDNAEFQPWKDIFFSGTDGILLVEGAVDKDYFELLRMPVHGDNSLGFDGEVFPYGGKDVLRNSVLLRFIMNRYKKMFITYDLDAEPAVLRCLESLGLQRHKDFLPIGVNAPGKKAIEGLLPDAIPTEVYSRHPAIVQQAMNGTAEEKESAKAHLKQLMFEDFRRRSQPGDEYYGRFYHVVKEINRALR